jgi:hypothetical protein
MVYVFVVLNGLIVLNWNCIQFYHRNLCFTGISYWSDYYPSRDLYLESFEQVFQGRTASCDRHHELQPAATPAQGSSHQLMSKGNYKSNYKQDKGFRCRKCGKMYQWKESLYNHEKLECGKEPQFKCLHCPYRSKLKWNLQTHIKRKHPQDSFKIS